MTGNFPTLLSGSIDGTTIVMRYTLFGDATLDSQVTSSDFDSLAANFGASDKYWYQGDFNYDGIVNALDFNALATNYGSPLPSSPADDATTPLTSIVPEPSLGIAALGGLIFARRRTRY